MAYEMTDLEYNPGCDCYYCEQHVQRIDAARFRNPYKVRSMNRILILDAMVQLPVEQRAVIRRSFYDSWTVGQIADDLRVDRQTVLARLHYGVRALHLFLEDGRPR